MGTDALLSAVPGAASGSGIVVAVVGAGGKTSVMFRLAEEARAAGRRVLVATTTRIWDPRDQGRRMDAFLEDGRWALPWSAAVPLPEPPDTAGGGWLAVASAGSEGGKLVSVDPSVLCAARAYWDLLVIEADGARGRSIKAPADHEPVVPCCSDSVLALVGMDALGEPLDDAIAFRPELIAQRGGGTLAGPVRACLLVALAAHPEGLFKGTPSGADRIVVLNKLDAADLASARELATALLDSGAVDRVVAGSFGAGRAGRPELVQNATHPLR